MRDWKETKLLSEFQKGNKKAFEIIYNLYWKGLYLHAYKRLNAEDLAEELVQELFIQLWEKRREIKVEKSLQHYLYGIIKKKILYHLRERYREAAHYQAFRENVVTVNGHLEHRIEQRDMLQNIEDLVQKLPAKSRRIFELSRKKFLSNKEIACRLNISEKAVEYHIHSSLRFIRTNCPDYLSYLFLWALFF
ncbi:MAG: RNA polymerase sigma-70 factor [Cytophagales bacterium]|nr:RNA polymerase sigma-70 factor [Cytophagales bacterium]